MSVVRVVLNKCFGGYSLSKEAYEFMNIPWDDQGYAFNEDRANPLLVRCVETLGEKANGKRARLKIESIYFPEVNDLITEIDGKESIG